MARGGPSTRARRRGRLSHRPARPGADEPILGTSDIQSLADLGNSYDLIKKMRIVPIQLNDFVAMALPGIVPVLPLAATVMPLSEIVKDLLRLLA